MDRVGGVGRGDSATNGIDADSVSVSAGDHKRFRVGSDCGYYWEHPL